MHSRYPLNRAPQAVPETMTKGFRLETQRHDGALQVVHEERNNYQRLVRVPVNVSAKAVRLVLEATRGAEQARIFGFDVR